MPSRGPTSRDFVPWRFLDACQLSLPRPSLLPASKNLHNSRSATIWETKVARAPKLAARRVVEKARRTRLFAKRTVSHRVVDRDQDVTSTYRRPDCTCDWNREGLVPTNFRNMRAKWLG